MKNQVFAVSSLFFFFVAHRHRLVHWLLLTKLVSSGFLFLLFETRASPGSGASYSTTPLTTPNSRHRFVSASSLSFCTRSSLGMWLATTAVEFSWVSRPSSSPSWQTTPETTSTELDNSCETVGRRERYDLTGFGREWPEPFARLVTWRRGCRGCRTCPRQTPTCGRCAAGVEAHCVGGAHVWGRGDCRLSSDTCDLATSKQNQIDPTTDPGWADPED